VEYICIGYYVVKKRNIKLKYKIEKNGTLKKDKELSITGMESKRRDTIPWLQKALDAMFNMILRDTKNGTEKAMLYLREEVMKPLKSGNLPWSNILLTKNLSKSCEDYRAKANLGPSEESKALARQKEATKSDRSAVIDRWYSIMNPTKSKYFDSLMCASVNGNIIQVLDAFESYMSTEYTTMRLIPQTQGFLSMWHKFIHLSRERCQDGASNSMAEVFWTHLEEYSSQSVPLPLLSLNEPIDNNPSSNTVAAATTIATDFVVQATNVSIMVQDEDEILDNLNDDDVAVEEVEDENPLDLDDEDDDDEGEDFDEEFFDNNNSNYKVNKKTKTAAAAATTTPMMKLDGKGGTNVKNNKLRIGAVPIHVRVAERQNLRTNGNGPKSGTRIYYIVTKKALKDMKTAECGEDPLYAYENKIVPDFGEHYYRQVMKTIARNLTPLFRHVLTSDQNKLHFKQSEHEDTDGDGDDGDDADDEETKKLTNKEEMIVMKHIKRQLEVDMSREEIVSKYTRILSEDELKSTLERIEQNRILNRVFNNTPESVESNEHKRKAFHSIGCQSTLQSFMDRAPKVAKKKHCLKCRVIISENDILCDTCVSNGQDLAIARVVDTLESKYNTIHTELHKKCHECKGSQGSVPLEQGYPSCKQIECNTLWERIYNTETRNKITSVTKCTRRHVSVAYTTSGGGGGDNHTATHQPLVSDTENDDDDDNIIINVPDFNW
jgi:hypothetical protein